MKTIHALRTVSGLNPEMEAGSFRLPDELCMALEERFGTEEPTEPVIDAELIPVLIPRAEKRMLQACFGKWLPNGADSVIQSTRDYLIQHAEERGYPLDVTDHIAATVWNCQRVKELEKWKEEQKTIRRAQRHFLHEETAKQNVNGKRQWVDATVYELPPLVQSDGKSMKHVPARYAVLLPNGQCWDLGRTQGAHAPILSDGPDIALQRIAKRAGLSVRGGAHTILQMLTGYVGIVPSYMTVWSRNQWLVLVGWHRDAKLTDSSYSLGIDGELTRAESPDGFLSLSELDYHLLKGAAETEIEDATGEIVDYMNEDEELVMQGFMRDETDEPEPMDSFLLIQAAANMGLAVELRNGSAVWNHPELRDQLAVMARDLRKERHQLTIRIDIAKRQMRQIMSRLFNEELEGFEKFDLQMKHMELSKTEFKLKAQRSQLFKSFKDQLADIESQSELVPLKEEHPTPFNTFGSMRGTESNPPLMETVRTEPFMALSPANEVQLRNVVVETDTMPEHRTVRGMRVKRGTMAVTGFDLGLGLPVKKAIPKLPQTPLTARNAHPKLKEKLRTIIREELETGTLEQEVADTFALALNQALAAITR